MNKLELELDEKKVLADGEYNLDELYGYIDYISHGVSHCADLLVGALLGAGGQLDSHHCTVRDEHHRPQ